MAPTWVKTQDDPWATPASLLEVGEGISITPWATVAFGGLEVMGARVYDPATGSFLSVDPLLAPPEAAWASNPYSYAGNDPVGFSDPTGLAPVSDAQLAAYNQAHSGAISQAWNVASSWVKDNW
ncbi:RHS repeat-associated core domain-containing protein [uncultured Actinomyces sp.]|uniref:RHS repeat-associated core domain-containing protein n=1 Tax=uncultured Actinomyces sp. TaxID=249061 RepID=UPI00288B62AA|nr:RHS repeat-associated core domain-containing protein [uncultured Actinomyces sp.]